MLTPGGIFLLSTYNLDGPSVRERPWNMPGLNWSDPRRTLARIKYRVVTLPKGLRNYRRLDQAYSGGDDWQVHINGSHEFGIVVHHITLTAAIAELEAAGFGEVQAWSGNDGAVLKPGYFTRPVWYFHFMCVKQG